MRVSKEPEVRRAEFISAARELFDRNGIKNTQISHIVEKVGVAKGLFYYYFKSKNEIVDEVMQIVMEELKESIRCLVSDDNLDFYEKLSGFILVYLDMIDQFSGDEEKNLALMLEATNDNPIVQQANEYMLEQLDRLIDQGVQQKYVCVRLPHEMARMILFGLLTRAKQELYSLTELLTLIEEGMHLKPHSLRLKRIKRQT